MTNKMGDKNLAIKLNFLFNKIRCINCCVTNQANIYLFRVNNINTRQSREMCFNLTIKTSERRH